MNVAPATPPAPRVSPAWQKRARGLLAVPVAVVLVTVAPGLANAAFTARANAAMSLGTYKIPAPSSVTGTLQCQAGNGQSGATITFTDIGEVDRATGYTASLTPPVGSPSKVLLGGQGPFQVTMSSGSGPGGYIFRVTAEVGSWTGAPLEQIVTC